MHVTLFRSKSFILIEFLLALTCYGAITGVFWAIFDNSFQVPIVYGGLFLLLQIIWQTIQYKKERASNSDIYEVYACKNALALFAFVIMGSIFFIIHVIYFHPLFEYKFEKLGSYSISKVEKILTEPDQYATVSRYYDDYYSMKFLFPYVNELNISNVTGCGCGVSYGSFGGTIGSPISPVYYTKEQYLFQN